MINLKKKNWKKYIYEINININRLNIINKKLYKLDYILW